MKKLTLVSCAVTMMLSASAFAADGTAASMGGTITSADCSPLASDVTVNLSKDVQGAYICRPASVVGAASMPARVGVGSCHKSGTTKARLVTCTAQADPATAGAFLYTPTTCTAGNFEADGTTAKADAAGKVEMKGQSMFTAASFGGKVAAEDMGTSVCDNAATVGGLIATKYP